MIKYGGAGGGGGRGLKAKHYIFVKGGGDVLFSIHWTVGFCENV